MAWTRTFERVLRFEQVFTRLSKRIETAKKRKEQVTWINYRKWYVNLVKQTKSALRELRNDLSKNITLNPILQNFENSLDDIFNLDTLTEEKWAAIVNSKEIWSQFKSELDKQVKSEYDMFRKRSFELDPRLCFVLMPFDKKNARHKPFMRVYRVIKATVRKANLKCKRADEIFGVKPIVQDIWEYINRATLLIADLTGRNANVFYETGLSHALPKKVIFLTQTMDDVPFDIKYIRCIVYENTDTGRKKLARDLYKTIKTSLK